MKRILNQKLWGILIGIVRVSPTSNRIDEFFHCFANALFGLTSVIAAKIRKIMTSAMVWAENMSNDTAKNKLLLLLLL